MTRYPDPNAKTPRLILAGKPGQEEKIQWLREWCLRNNRHVTDILYEKVEEMARLHGFPDGHSQTKLDFADNPKMLPLWKTCSQSRGELRQGLFSCKRHGLMSPARCEKLSHRIVNSMDVGCYHAKEASQ